MKVAMLSPSLSRIAGGIFEIERELSHALARIPGVDVTAYGVEDAKSRLDLPAWAPIPVRLAPLVGPHGFGYAPGLARPFLDDDADIAHLHALWMYTSVLARRWKRRTGRPYVTTANGMLEPWARSNARAKKRLAALCYERAALREASCLHVNTRAEAESARAFGVPGPFCVIPNGVTLPDTIGIAGAPPEISAIRADGGRILLQLGRVHPKKNLRAALDGFGMVAADHPDWHLVFAGWGDPGYRAMLAGRVAEAGLTGRVHLLGPLYDAAKAATLAAADGFVLASHSEGFPMAVLEAFAYAKPVLMTAMCNLSEGFEAGAAIEVGTDPGAIAAGLRRLFGASAAEREAMGARGRALVESRFTWDRIAGQMHEVYAWLLGGGAPPPTVIR